MDAEQAPQQLAPRTLITKLNLGPILTGCFEDSEFDICSQTLADTRATFLADLLKPLADSPEWIQLLLTLIDTCSAKDIPAGKMAYCLIHGRGYGCCNSDDSVQGL